MKLSTKPYGLAALIVLAITLVVGANVWKSSLKVRKIIVEGNRIVQRNEILQLVQVPAGSLLYGADLTSIQRNVMSHYYIKDATVERDLPTTIRVVVVERTPIAVVNRAEMLYLDEEGMILPRSLSKELFDLPVISGIPESTPLKVGLRQDQPDVLESLAILSTMKSMTRDLYHAISEVRVRGGGDIVLFAAETGVPLIFGRGEIASKLARLEKFWNEIIHIRGTQNLQYIDLRYEDQIVVRWKPQSNVTKAL